MEVVKELTPELVKAEAKDRFYLVEGTIKRMLAYQQYSRPIKIVKAGWGSIERVESFQDGSPTDKRAPSKKSKIRTGESETRIDKCWTFKEENGHLFVPIGDNWGLIKSSLRRSLTAQKKVRYDAPPLELMLVYPLWLDVGKAPPESLVDGHGPEKILETRNTPKGRVMVETFWDYIENRPLKFILEVDSECPINEEKLVALLKSLNTLDSPGPSKRGKLKITKIDRVQPSEKELEKMSKGEPVEPVVY
jgi:hypothetical protein